MLGIDEGSDTASLLSLSNSVDGKRCLTTRLRTVYLYNASLGVAANAEGSVKSDTSSRDNIYILYFLVAHTHDAALAKVFLYLRHSSLQGFHLLLLWSELFALFFFLCHSYFFRG